MDIDKLPSRPAYVRGEKPSPCKKEQEGVKKTTERGEKSSPEPSLSVSKSSSSAAKTAAGEPPSEQPEPEPVREEVHGSHENPDPLGDLGSEYKAKHPPVEAARTVDAPWINWGGGSVRARNGVSAASLRRVGWLLERETTLYPVEGRWNGWVKGLAQMHEAGRGEWEVIKAGIVAAWAREPRYRPTHPAGFVGEIQKAWAAKHQKQERASLAPGGRRLVNVRDIPDEEL